MSALIVVAVLAAQATGPAGSATSENREGSQPGIANYLDLEAGAGYSSNPFQSLVDDNGAGFGRIGLHAVHTRLSARTSTVLSGFAQSQFYTNNHGSEQSLDLSARHEA